MDIIMLRKSLIPVWFFLLIIFWATSILGDVQKTLPPPPADSQEKYDQTGPQATSSDSSASASMNPSIEKGANDSPLPLPPPPLQIQESFGFGG
jgi:hypothetical protein